MSCSASSVEPPMCGVRITFGRPRSAETNSSPAPQGSSGNTSIAAAAMWPVSMPRRAVWSTTKPRDRLRNRLRGCMAANSASPNRPLLPAAIHVQGDDIYRLEQFSEGAAAARVTERELVGDVVEVHRHAQVFRQNRQLGADVAIAHDPELRPRISWLPEADLSHTPAYIFALFSGSRRAIEMISARTSSTTLRVFEKGALNTATPRRAAAARSIWFTPMQKAPIATRSAPLRGPARSPASATGCPAG